MPAAVGVARGSRVAVVGEVHLIHMLRRVVGELRLVVGAEVLSPHVFASAILQQSCHLAALKLLLGYRRALCCAAGVEVVAVVDGGVGGEGVAVAVGVVRVVLADVEAVGQGAGAMLAIYKSAYAFPAFVRRGSDISFDDTVGDGNDTLLGHIRNHSGCSTGIIVIAALESHVADAVRDCDTTMHFINQSGHPVAFRCNLAFGAQVADDAVFHTLERGYVLTFAGIPVERQRMSLSVERAGVPVGISAHHRDVSSEVDVLDHLGVELGLSAVYESAELLPVVLCGNLEVVAYEYGYSHGAVFIDGGAGIESTLKGDRVIFCRVV